MGLFNQSGIVKLKKWAVTASEKSLYDEYEKYRVVHFGPDGDGEKSPEMKIIDNELTRRDVEKMKKDPLYNPNRHARLMKVKWDADGRPVFSFK